MDHHHETVSIGRHLTSMVQNSGSDMFLHTGSPIVIKASGKFIRLQPVLKPGDVERIARTFMNDKAWHSWEERLQADFAISIPGLGRFRANLFRQRGEASLVIRYIQTEVPTLESLLLPEVLSEIISWKNGLIMVAGATGSGKSTTLAAMIDYRNKNYDSHIITLEDPIEYIHQHGRSLIAQREVGTDVHSWEDGINAAMREAPDVILLGEVRNAMTMDYAMKFANTGHLALSTIHSNDSVSTIDRIIGFYKKEDQQAEAARVSENLRAVVSQRLLPTKDNKMCAAIEIMKVTPLIQEKIKKLEVDDIKEIIQKGRDTYRMQTFDQSIIDHYKAGRISAGVAVSFADSKTNMKLELRKIQGLSDTSDSIFDETIDSGTTLSLKEEEDDSQEMRFKMASGLSLAD